MVGKQGAVMALLGRLTWRITQKPQKKGCVNYQTQKRPLFLPSKYFTSSFHLQTKYRDGKDVWDLPEDITFDAAQVATKYVSV